MTERVKLALHMLRYHRFSAEMFRRSTVDIAQGLGEKFRDLVPCLLNEVYDLREQEERL